MIDRHNDPRAAEHLDALRNADEPFAEIESMALAINEYFEDVLADEPGDNDDKVLPAVHRAIEHINALRAELRRARRTS